MRLSMDRTWPSFTVISNFRNKQTKLRMCDYKDILCNTFDVITWYHDSYVKRISSLPIMGCRKCNLKQNNQFYSLSFFSTCRFTTSDVKSFPLIPLLYLGQYILPSHHF